MSSRARRLVFAMVGLVLALFVGHWGAGVLADRWWAETLSPEAAAFVTRYHLLRVVLEATGILLAAGWFIAHLLVLCRAIGSVQVPRQVANLEIREALTARTLVLISIGVGGLAGIMVGGGAVEWWNPVLLAWNGADYGEVEPFLGLDLGVYVSQLPLWRLLHGYAMLLALLTLGGILMLYVLIGSVRWLEGRPAISDYSRTHLGLLLAALALGLVWGYLLEPYEFVAGLGDPPSRGLFRVHSIVAQALAGVALATALLSTVWALRPRHTLVAASWTVLALASVLGHHLVPALAGQGGTGARDLDPAVQQHLDALAYGLTGLKEQTLQAVEGYPPLPAPAALWHSSLVTRVAASDSADVLSADRTVLKVGGHPRAVWLVVRAAPGGRATVAAIADDRVSVLGGALSYQEADTFAYPQPVTRLDLSPGAVRPGAPDYALDTLAQGVPIGGRLRRIALAWALQAGRLLQETAPGYRVSWPLSPAERLARLAPFVEWGPPMARLIAGRLVWFSDGYLTSATFPIADRVRVWWKSQPVGSIRAGFVGTVDAESGETHVYLRHTADPLAEAWAQVSGGVVQAASAIPAEAGRAVAYPPELFRAQARILENSPWSSGKLIGLPDSSMSEVPRPQAGWDRDTSGVFLLLPFEQPEERRVGAVLVGSMADGWETLRLFRLDSLAGLPSPTILESRWNRFTTFEQIRDSVQKSGGEWKDGPIRLAVGPGGVIAYHTYFGLTPYGDPALVWVSLAFGDRLGAGRNLVEAWHNLQGFSAPVIAGGSPVEQVDEARRWVAAADSAFRRGDLEAFGRAFEALKRVLQAGPSRHK